MNEFWGQSEATLNSFIRVGMQQGGGSLDRSANGEAWVYVKLKRRGDSQKKRCGGKSGNELFSSVEAVMVVMRGSGSLTA